MLSVAAMVPISEFVIYLSGLVGRERESEVQGALSMRWEVFPFGAVAGSEARVVVSRDSLQTGPYICLSRE